MSDAFNERLRLIRFRRKREHFKFTQELRIIPRWLAWTCVALTTLAIIIGVSINLHNMQFGGDVFPPDMRNQPLLASLALGGLILLMGAMLTAHLSMLGYVYQDAKRRSMHPALWTIVVLILSPGYGILGLIIYLLVREPLPYSCPQCATTVSARFNFCPNCKTNLHPACAHCQREVSDTDKFCPYCGNNLMPASPADGTVQPTT
jgi:RNA polymerase subunit RPABC4/transcription elongation factor Spt4